MTRERINEILNADKAGLFKGAKTEEALQMLKDIGELYNEIRPKEKVKCNWCVRNSLLMFIRNYAKHI